MCCALWQIINNNIHIYRSDTGVQELRPELRERATSLPLQFDLPEAIYIYINIWIFPIICKNCSWPKRWPGQCVLGLSWVEFMHSGGNCLLVLSLFISPRVRVHQVSSVFWLFVFSSEHVSLFLQFDLNARIWTGTFFAKWRASSWIHVDLYAYNVVIIISIHIMHKLSLHQIYKFMHNMLVMTWHCSCVADVNFAFIFGLSHAYFI